MQASPSDIRSAEAARSPGPDRVPARVDRGPIVRIVLGYALLSAAWILGSDWLLGQLVQDRGLLTQLATLKGWAFVAASSITGTESYRF